MPLPKRVRIGPVDYAVRVVKGLKLDGEAVDGQCRLTTNEIRIEAGLGPQMQRQTLWHEIIHALVYQDQLGAVRLDSERAVDRLAWGVMQVVRDNPGLRI